MLSTLNNMALKLDPALILNDLGIAPDPWQKSLLRSSDPRILILAHRQAGKSTAVSGLALWTALFDPGLVLIVSPSLRQSAEFFSKIVAAYVAMGRPVPTTEDNSTTLALSNGSRICSLPGSEQTIRGFSAPRLVIVDEASRVGDEIHAALSPMLTVGGGRLVELSTPYGQRGHFHDAWTAGGDDWRRFSFRASENPRLDPRFLEVERRTLGPRWYAQEYECEFVSTLDQVFDSEIVAGAFSSTAGPLFQE